MLKYNVMYVYVMMHVLVLCTVLVFYVSNVCGHLYVVLYYALYVDVFHLCSVLRMEHWRHYTGYWRLAVLLICVMVSGQVITLFQWWGCCIYQCGWGEVFYHE